MTIIAALTRTETRYSGVAGDGGWAMMVPQEVLVNPDGPAAADLIKDLCSALGEARFYVDDCFGRADQNLSSQIDSLLLKAGRA